MSLSVALLVSLVFLPVSTAPRPSCELSDATFIDADGGGGHVRVALSSFPGSGNTWARILLEKATGRRTGSEYFDKKLVRAGLAGEGTKHLNDTLCFKTHWPVIQGPEPSYERAIVVVRHPADAALSYACVSPYARRMPDGYHATRQAF
jgi:hypothetical protein